MTTGLALPPELAQDLLEVIEKGAAAVDEAGLACRAAEKRAAAAEARVQALEAELKQAKQASARPLFSDTLLSKLASQLEKEQLLPTGVDAKRACELIRDNPDRLVDLMIRYTAAPEPDGRGIKSASTADVIPGLPDGARLVEYAGQPAIDYDGWTSGFLAAR